jgi:ATP adenylyltransferase/5',5'''-P-1,P-4-tetraphosphate phosphorylase II
LKDEEHGEEYAILVCDKWLGYVTCNNSHLAQLNKYSVIPHHFLLVTKGQISRVIKVLI